MVTPEITDRELVDLLQQAATRERGFRVLMRQYRQRLYTHAHHMMGNHADADDVLQNTFIKAWRGIGSFQGKSQLYTWLYRITTNEALTLLKQRKRRQSQPLEATVQTALVTQPGHDSEAILRLLYAATDTLPPRQKAVFNLRYFEEMPYQQMSEVLGVSVGGLKANYHHAVKKIEDYLGHHANEL